MFKELVANAAILISAISIGNAIFKKVPLAKRYQCALAGVFTGVLGCLLIQFSFPVGSSVIVDLRAIPLIITAFYISIPSLAVATSIIGISRLFAFGVSPTSIVGALSVVAVACVCALLRLSRMKMCMKWSLSAASVSVVSAISLLVLHVSASEFWLVLLGYNGRPYYHWLRLISLPQIHHKSQPRLQAAAQGFENRLLNRS